MRSSQIRLGRFRLLLAVLVLAAFGCGTALARERPVTAPAARFLQDTLDRAFGLARPPVSEQAASDLADLVGRAMDWPALSRFAIGHYGARLDAHGMGRVTERLERHVTTLARRAGAEFPTLTVAIHDLRLDPDGSRRILSTATVPRFGVVEVQWTLVPGQSGYRIADVKALGMTLSQFLRSWVASLVAAQGGDAAATFGNPATSPR